MKIEIDEGKCIGAGNCVMVAEEVYDQRDDDAVAFLLDVDLDSADVQTSARAGAAACPAAAIRVNEGM
jgi:ferredoxin